MSSEKDHRLKRYRCQHCGREIYLDNRGKWRHKEFVSWCRTVAVGPNDTCWCGREET